MIYKKKTLDLAGSYYAAWYDRLTFDKWCAIRKSCVIKRTKSGRLYTRRKRHPL